MTGSDVNIGKAGRRDSALVVLAKAGSAPAIDQLIRKYWPDAYRTAARILRCHADAEEAAQDVLCSAVAHLPTFREDASFRTWIYRITVNQSLMLLRRRHGKAESRVPVSLEQVAPLISGTRTPEQVLLDAEYRAVVEEGLEHLPERYGAVLQLSVFEGKSASEIAASVGLSPAAVKTRLHRGRARLQQEISRRLRLHVTEKDELRRRVRQHGPALQSKRSASGEARRDKCSTGWIATRCVGGRGLGANRDVVARTDPPFECRAEIQPAGCVR
jgi:RNA polymerase sigma-70 factor (ECF subfamily)